MKRCCILNLVSGDQRWGLADHTQLSTIARNLLVFRRCFDPDGLA